MKLNNLNKIKLLIFVLFIGLITGYIFNSIFFLHSHIDQNGTKIHHAHPYKKSSDNNSLPTHHHTADEIVFLEFSSVLFEFKNEIVLEHFSNFITAISSYEYSFNSNLYYTATNSRGPPTLKIA